MHYCMLCVLLGDIKVLSVAFVVASMSGML